MPLKIDSVSKCYFRKPLFMAFSIKSFLSLTSLFCASLIIFFALCIHPVNASDIQNEKLMERISNDYTKKFCNSMAFGLSKESSMMFANKENNMIFEKKKGIDSLNRELTANRIAVSVIETCGHLISLKGEEGVSKFQKDYISMNNNLLDKNQ